MPTRGARDKPRHEVPDMPGRFAAFPDSVDSMRLSRVLKPLLTLALFSAALSGVPGHAFATGSASDANPWDALDELRFSLRSASPLTADFAQTFLPAGFSEGELEEGTLGISMPHCLRWDYGEPFAKSFLLCNDTAYYWNPGETHGRRYPVANEEAPGLDFFLLDTEDLRLRYNATAEETPAGLRVELLPIRPTDDVVELIVLLDSDRHRVVTLSYRDAEGNLTEFAMTDYRTGARPGMFTPPPEVVWEDP